MKQYILAIVLTIGFFVIFFSIMSFVHIKKEYQNQKLKILLLGVFAEQKYFDKIGWKYRIASLIFLILGIMLIILLSFL